MTENQIISTDSYIKTIQQFIGHRPHSSPYSHTSGNDIVMETRKAAFRRESPDQQKPYNKTLRS